MRIFKCAKLPASASNTWLCNSHIRRKLFKSVTHQPGLHSSSFTTVLIHLIHICSGGEPVNPVDLGLPVSLEACHLTVEEYIGYLERCSVCVGFEVPPGNLKAVEYKMPDGKKSHRWDMWLYIVYSIKCDAFIICSIYYSPNVCMYGLNFLSGCDLSVVGKSHTSATMGLCAETASTSGVIVSGWRSWGNHQNHILGIRRKEHTRVVNLWQKLLLKVWGT